MILTSSRVLALSCRRRLRSGGMPLEFLSDAQVAGYGRFGGVPSQADLERFFVLDDTDRCRIGDRRGDHNRLGFVLQATTVRYVGRFLEDPLDVPWPVVEYLASQLGIVDASCVKRYPDRVKTAYEHAWEIRDAYGFRVFEDEAVSLEFRRFLDGRAWTLEEGPAALFEAGVGWLRRHLVLLPGVTVLTRLVNTVRDAAADRMHTLLAAAATITDPMLPGRLRAALRVPAGSRFSELEQWRRSPTRVSGPGMVKALDRASELAGLRAREVDCSAVPANRMAALARHGLVSSATTLHGLAEPRRTATLLAMARHLDTVAIDDALDLFALLMTTRLINPARTASNNARLASLPRLERASRTLARVGRELLHTLERADAGDGGDATAVWAAVETIASREQIARRAHRAAVGRWAARLGRRAAVRGPGPHPQRQARHRSTSATSAASPGSTRSMTRSPGSAPRWCPARRATACTSSTCCSTWTPVRSRT